MKQKIVAIIPCYNEENILEEYILSLINQEFDKDKIDFDIVICNNNSTDKTESILNKYSDKIVILNQKIQGINPTRRLLQDYICEEYFYEGLNFNEDTIVLNLDIEIGGYQKDMIQFIYDKFEFNSDLKLLLGDNDNWEYVGVDSELVDFRNKMCSYADLNGIIMNSFWYAVRLRYLACNKVPLRRVYNDETHKFSYDTIDDIIFLLSYFDDRKSYYISGDDELDYVDTTKFFKPRVDNKLQAYQHYNNNREEIGIEDAKKNILFSEISYYIIMNLFIFPEESIYKEFGKNEELEKLVNHIQDNYIYTEKYLTYEKYSIISAIIYHLFRDYFDKNLDKYPVFELRKKIRQLNNKKINYFCTQGKKEGLDNEEIFDVIFDNLYLNYYSIESFLVDYV